MLPICVKCGREMRCKKNGVVVYHPYEKPDESEPLQIDIGGIHVINVDKLLDWSSISETDIDFIVHGDLYECDSCKNQIVTGFGQKMLDCEVPQKLLKSILAKAKYAVELRRR